MTIKSFRKIIIKCEYLKSVLLVYFLFELFVLVKIKNISVKKYFKVTCLFVTFHETWLTRCVFSVFKASLFVILIILVIL